MATPVPSSTSTPPLKVYPPFLAKNFVSPPKWLNFRKVLSPPLIRGEGVPTMMNPNDVMGVVLKDIILCSLGFRFILVDIWSACLSCLPICQSNFNGWFRSQGNYRATLEFKSSGCVVSNNLIYDSSLSLSVSVKVIPKSFDTCLNST